MEDQEGYLELIIGPMFSGKTTFIIDLYNNLQEGIAALNKNEILVINSHLDNRYDKENLVSHKGFKIPCIKTDKLENLVQNKDINFTNISVILINEAQFFPDLIVFVRYCLENNKKIYVSGLDGDFKQNKFGSIIDLIPLCDSVKKLKAICGNCQKANSAIFSFRTINNNDQTLIGAEESYIPACRTCFKKLSPKSN